MPWPLSSQRGRRDRAVRIPPRVLLGTGGLGIGLLGAIALPLGMGCTLLLSDPQRYASPTFAVAKTLTGGLPWLAPMAWWGLLMLVGAVVLTAGTVLGDLDTLRLGLVIGAGFWGFWAAQYLLAGLVSPVASLAAPWIYLSITLTHIALAQGVAKAPER